MLATLHPHLHGYPIAMAKRLMGLRHVPEDEIDEVRALLAQAGIEFHLTPSGPLGISAGAIWITRDGQFDQARRLFDDYQTRRAAQARAEREAELRDGRVRGFFDVLRDEPLRVIAVLAGIVFLLGLSLIPYFLLRA